MTNTGWSEEKEIKQSLDNNDITCTEAFIYIRQAMVDYDPHDRYYRNKKGNIIFGVGGQLLRKEPDIPKNIMTHINKCDICKNRLKLLSGKMLRDGELEVMSVGISSKTASEKNTCFSGTPDKIISGIINYYGQPVKTESERAGREIKVRRELLSAIGINYDQNSTISDYDLLRLLIIHNIMRITADPWFVYSEKLEGMI